MKKPQLVVDAFAPALARLVGACGRAHATALFAVREPLPLPRSPDLALDDQDDDTVPATDVASAPRPDGALRA